jgi:hypothetical protein
MNRDERSDRLRGLLAKHGDVVFLSLGVLCILLTWSIFYFDSDKSILVLVDASTLTYPWWMYSVGEIQQGRLPLWDPYTLGGMSHVGELARAALYPPFLLVALLGESVRTTAAIHAFALAHFLVAFGAAYFLGRVLRMPPVGAFACGVMYSLGGCLAKRALGQLDIFNAQVWVPLILAGLIAVARTRNWKWSLLSGAAMAMSILAGHHQPAIHAAILFGVTSIGVCFFRLGEIEPLGIRRTVVAGAVATISAAGLAALQLLPSLEYIPIAFRWVGATDPETGSAWTVASARVPFDVMAMNPRLEPRSWPTILYQSVGNIPDGSLYLGIAGISLAVIGLRCMDRTSRVLWLTVLLAGFILAHGSATPLLKLAYFTIPLFEKIREPVRHLFLAHIAIAIAAGYGATGLSRMRRASPLFFLAVSSGAVLTAWHVWRVRGDLPLTVTLPLTLVLLAAVILAVQRLQKIPTAFLLPVLLIGMFVELGGGWARQVGRISRFDGKTNFAVEKYYHSPTSLAVAAFLKQHPGLYRVDFLDDRIPANYGHILRFPTTAGYTATRPATFFNVRNHLGWFPPAPGADLLSIRYVFASRELPGARLAGSIAGLSVYENETALPFAWFVKSVVVSESEERTLALLQSRQIDPAETAIVSRRRALAVRDLPTGNERNEVRIITYDPQLVAMATTSVDRALLATTDPYYPGWSAWIDGVRTPLIRVNYAFRGVVVPPGKHRVEFRYRPMTFRAGVAISILTLLTTALIVFLPAAVRIHAHRKVRDGLA